MLCLAYKAYDWYKQTWLASKLVYGGQRFRHFGPIERHGIVKACSHNAKDGDRCFDLVAADGPWHCEVTPCSPAPARAAVSTLHIGQEVIVAGTQTYDPPHHIGPIKFGGGGNEIHPVSTIEVLL